MSAHPFKIAIIGAGGIANAHAAAIKDSAGKLQLVAVVDPIAANSQKIAETGTGVATFVNVKDFLAAAKDGLECDGVVIATPPSVRVDLVATCLKAGYPVMTEKPIAATIADAKKIAALGKKYKKLKTFVGYCHRFTPAVNTMLEMVAAGKIGRVVRFENFFACDLPGHETKWFSDPKKAGGGAFLDMGSHSIDLFHYMIGPAKVSASIFDHKWKKRTETAATVLLKGTKKKSANIPAGVPGVIFSGWAETSRFTVALVGDKGMLSYDYEKPEELVFRDLLGKAEVMPIQTCGVRFTQQLLAFAAAATSRTKSPAATFEDGLNAALVGEQATKLARKK